MIRGIDGPAWRGFYFVIETSPWWQPWLLATILYMLWDQYALKYLPIHKSIISPNFFVPAYICQLYNPFITSKSFGKQQIKAGIIKGFLLKHAFFEAQSTMPSVLPLWKDAFSCLIRTNLHSIRRGQVGQQDWDSRPQEKKKVYLFQLQPTLKAYCNFVKYSVIFGMNEYM